MKKKVKHFSEQLTAQNVSDACAVWNSDYLVYDDDDDDDDEEDLSSFSTHQIKIVRETLLLNSSS